MEIEKGARTQYEMIRFSDNLWSDKQCFIVDRILHYKAFTDYMLITCDVMLQKMTLKVKLMSIIASLKAK